MKLHSFLLILFTLLSLTIQTKTVHAYQEQKNNCLFPVKDGNLWQYQIYKDGQKVGVLKMEVVDGKEDNTKVSDLLGELYPDSWTGSIKFEDSYLQKTYYQSVFNYYAGYVYLFDLQEKRLFPFLRQYLREGDQIGNRVVTSSGTKSFQGKRLQTFVLKDLNEPIVEEYMEYTGLYYYKNENLEYKLEAAMVQNCSYYVDSPGRPR